MASSRSSVAPACDTTPRPSALTLTLARPAATLHPRSAFLSEGYRSFGSSIFLCRQGTSSISSPCRPGGEDSRQPPLSGHSWMLRRAASRMSCASAPARDSPMSNAATRRRTPAVPRAAAATSTTGRRKSAVRRRRRRYRPAPLAQHRGRACGRATDGLAAVGELEAEAEGAPGCGQVTRAAGHVLLRVAGAGPDPRGHEDLDAGGIGGQSGNRRGDPVGAREHQGVDRDNAGNFRLRRLPRLMPARGLRLGAGKSSKNPIRPLSAVPARPEMERYPHRGGPRPTRRPACPGLRAGAAPARRRMALTPRSRAGTRAWTAAAGAAPSADGLAGLSCWRIAGRSSGPCPGRRGGQAGSAASPAAPGLARWTPGRQPR